MQRMHTMQSQTIIYRSDLELVKREFPAVYARIMKNVEQGKVVIIEEL